MQLLMCRSGYFETISDNPNWGYSSHGATSIWVALDDATEANGCLYFIRGSHKVPTPYGIYILYVLCLHSRLK